MTFTTRGVKQTMDHPTPSSVEHENRGDDEAEEVSGEMVDKWGKKLRHPKK